MEIEDDGAVNEKNSEWEEWLLNKRNELLDIASSERKLEDKCENILKSVGAKIVSVSAEVWREIYLSLERMDESWTDVVAKIVPNDKIRNEKIYSRVLSYMIFRHILDAENESDLRARTVFCVHATYFISAVAEVLEKEGVKNADEEGARLYSSEIEYSDDNLYSLIDLFATEE